MRGTILSLGLLALTFAPWPSEQLVADALVPSSAKLPGGPPLNQLAQTLLRAPAEQLELWNRGEQQGLIEVKAVNLPTEVAGDCNHFGWPIAVRSGDAIVVMHRRIPGHNAKLSGRADPSMSYGMVVRSEDGGRTWSSAYDLRDCMAEEDRHRGGIVPISHRAKFDVGNKSKAGYKVHLHAIGATRAGGIVAINNHGAFHSENAGRTWQHFPTAFRDDHFPHPIVNIGPRIIDDPRHGLTVFGNWFGEVDQFKKMSQQFVVLTSTNGGAAWQVEEHPVGIPQYEPASLLHNDQYLLVTRDQSPQQNHKHITWQPGESPTVTKTNLREPRSLDTVDLSLNPVTGRLEMIRSERGTMDLWLWSLDPAEWSTGKWQRECRLLTSRGQFYKDADGFHPAAAVLDAERGIQHIFIYSGKPGGPAGIFRITRTLDTPALKALLDTDSAD